MSFNFAELQQKANRVIHNSDEFVRKWVEFISAPAGNINLEYYDQNGNLRTVSFSNRNKLVQDFIANANAVMSKTVYVDQANGDDGNDGGKSAPFKTIKKAVGSIPAGGSGIVILANNQTHSINTAIEFNSKMVYFRSWSRPSLLGSADANSPIIKFEDDGSKLTGVFNLLNSCILIAGYSYPVKIQVGNLTSNITGVAINGHFYPDGSTSLTSLSIAHTNVNISDGALLFSNISKASFRYATVKKYSSTDFIIGNAGYGVLEFQISMGIITDINENDISSQCIGGIVKDANGIPRNIVSNIII